jgi:hypothetical protein
MAQASRWGVGTLLCMLAGIAFAQTDKSDSLAGQEIHIELNKLEPQDNACRTYLVLDNRTKMEFDEIGLDVFIFGKDGVIARRVALTFRPIKPAKTRVVLFDIANVKCESIGRFLINSVLSCKTPNGNANACTEMLTVSTRTDAELAD